MTADNGESPQSGDTANMADSRGINTRAGARLAGGGLAARKRLAEAARIQAMRSTPVKRTVQRPLSASPSSNTAVRGRKISKAPLSGGQRFNSNFSTLENRFKCQLRKYKMDLNDYKKAQQSMEGCYEELMNLRNEMLQTMEIDPGEVPKPFEMATSAGGDNNKRLSELEEELQTAKENMGQMTEEKNKLERNLHAILKHLQIKEQDLLALDKEMEEELRQLEDQENHFSPYCDEQLRAFTEKVKQLQEERHRLVAVNLVTDVVHSVDPADGDVGGLFETVKQLQAELATEREMRMALEENCSQLQKRLTDQDLCSEQSDIQERLEHVNKILQDRNNEDAVKVDFSSDSKGLCSQLAQVIGLYEDVAKENDTLVDKLKEVQGQLNMLQRQVDVMVVKQVPESDFDYLKDLEVKCNSLQVQLSEMEAENDKMKSKISLLYHKYKQYKAECSETKKLLQSCEKKNWIKKLINL